MSPSPKILETFGPENPVAIMTLVEPRGKSAFEFFEKVRDVIQTAFRPVPSLTCPFSDSRLLEQTGSVVRSAGEHTQFTMAYVIVTFGAERICSREEAGDVLCERPIPLAKRVIPKILRR